MKKTFLSSLVLLTLLSCGKDKDECNKDTASISATYKVTAVKYKLTSSSAEVDYYNQFYTEACEKDDRIILAANGTATLVDAGIKCTPAGDDVTTWSVSGNTLTLDGDPLNIESFDCSTLAISESNAMTTGDKVIIVLTKQ